MSETEDNYKLWKDRPAGDPNSNPKKKAMDETLSPL